MNEQEGASDESQAWAAVSAELRQLFERAPGLAVVLHGPDHVFQYANPGYLRLMGWRDLEGKPLREAIPELEGQGFFELLDEVYRTGKPFEGREIPIQLPQDGDGPLEVGYFDFVYQPIVDRWGKVVGIFAQGSDITDRVRAERELRASEARFAGIFNQVTVGIAQTDLTGRFVLVNDRQCEILGRTREELLGLTMQAVTHPQDLPANEAEFRRLAATGEPFVIEKRYVRGDGSVVWVRNNVSAQRGPDGQAQYITAVVVDITAAKLAEMRQQLLMNELNHRVKNTLATVQSLAAQAARAEDPRSGHAAFLDRLMALSRAHDVLTREHWAGAELAAAAAAALAPFGGEDPESFSLQGPRVRLAPQEALALSMALHELATNAVKYGALSVPGGRVSISWEVGADDEDPDRPGRLTLMWREDGGPAVEPPTRQGFGSRLMRGLAQELAGTAMADWRPEGLVWRIDGRLTGEARTGDVLLSQLSS
ncbi:PAS domain S-box protein [Phenylobacterium sp.]|uniref:sensor histidine kinase n=1 Tax=Phenylobacterium sp. TaxID=1871053 RepID=UPI002F9286A0